MEFEMKNSKFYKEFLNENNLSFITMQNAQCAHRLFIDYVGTMHSHKPCGTLYVQFLSVN